MPMFDRVTDYAIISTDRHGKLLLWNKAATELIGLSNDTAGTSADILFTDDDQRLHAWSQEMKDALRTGGVPTNARCVTRDGATFWAEGVVSPMYDPDGAHTGFVKILRDVTAKRKAERNGFGYLTRGLDREAHERGQDIMALRDAVQNLKFHLAYQPKISPRDYRLVGMEALLRCDHPRFSSRPIQDLLVLAKESGQLKLLSEWIVRTACEQAAQWFAGGHHRFKMCVNLSAGELSEPKIVDVVDRVLDATGVLPADLDIELTEDEVFESREDGIRILRGLRERGVSIALDDFGAGYSTLSYLASLPIDLIKLDISFIRNLPEDRKVGQIVRSMIKLAHALDLIVIAEGIEKPEQMEFFHDVGCEGVQGFHICRPLPAAEITKWMQERRHCL